MIIDCHGHSPPAAADADWRDRQSRHQDPSLSRSVGAVDQRRRLRRSIASNQSADARRGLDITSLAARELMPTTWGDFRSGSTGSALQRAVHRVARLTRSLIGAAILPQSPGWIRQLAPDPPLRGGYASSRELNPILRRTLARATAEDRHWYPIYGPWSSTTSGDGSCLTSCMPAPPHRRAYLTPNHALHAVAQR